jgi:thiosulfate/3-mercaptopyruvate sulfurtransferase
MCFKDNQSLIKEFENKNVNLDNPIICYCGSGVTACINIFALNLLGKYDNVRLYDGSWAEIVNKIYYLSY